MSPNRPPSGLVRPSPGPHAAFGHGTTAPPPIECSTRRWGPRVSGRSAHIRAPPFPNSGTQRGMHLAHPAARPFPAGSRPAPFPSRVLGRQTRPQGAGQRLSPRGYWVAKPVLRWVLGAGHGSCAPHSICTPRLSHPGTRSGDRARALSPPLPCLMSLHGGRTHQAAPLAGTRSRAHGGTPTSAPSHRPKVVRTAPRQGAGRVSLDVLLSTQRILRPVPRIHMSGADWLPRPAATQTLGGTPAHRVLPCVCDMPSGATPLRTQRRVRPTRTQQHTKFDGVRAACAGGARNHPAPSPESRRPRTRTEPGRLVKASPPPRRRLHKSTQGTPSAVAVRVATVVFFWCARLTPGKTQARGYPTRVPTPASSLPARPQTERHSAEVGTPPPPGGLANWECTRRASLGGPRGCVRQSGELSR